MNRHQARPAEQETQAFGYWIAALAAAALLIRLLLAFRHGGFMSDQELFVDWMKQVQERGLGIVYIEGNNINYPPLFLLIMDGYRRIAGWFGIVPAAGELSFKGVLIALDLAAFAAAVRLTQTAGRTRARLFVLALLALNPALIFGSSVWGQVDMLHSLLMAASLLLLPGSPLLAGALFALALLSKFQAVTLLAVLGIYFLKRLIRSREWSSLVRFAAGFAAVMGVCGIFFAYAGGLKAMLKGAYLSAVGMYPQVTMNAMNIWYYFIGTPPNTSDTNHVFGTLTLRAAGFLLLALFVAYAAVYLWRSRTDALALLKSAALVNFAFFMLPTEIHERYSVPALVLAIFVCLYDRRWRLPAALLSISVTANLWMVQASAIGVYSGLAIVYVNLALLLWMTWALGAEMGKSRTTRTQEPTQPKKNKTRTPEIR